MNPDSSRLFTVEDIIAKSDLTVTFVCIWHCKSLPIEKRPESGATKQFTLNEPRFQPFVHGGRYNCEVRSDSNLCLYLALQKSPNRKTARIGCDQAVHIE